MANELKWNCYLRIFSSENYVGRDDAREELLYSYTGMNEIVKNMLVESIDTNGAVTNYKIL